MKQTKPVVMIAKDLIDPGIRKYEGKLDQHLQAIIKASGLSYTPYVFNDGRVLLVLPEKAGGLLYISEQVMEELLNIEK